MKLIILVPNVMKRYLASFPEATNNAYKYFNYDNRVVCESVPRGDVKIPYISPNTFNDCDYDSLVTAAAGCIDPILAKYSFDVACDDALSKAVRSFSNGLFDGKVNAGRFHVLLAEVKKKAGNQCSCGSRLSKKKTEKAEKPVEKFIVVKAPVLKQLGGKPGRARGPIPKGVHYLDQEKGKTVLKIKH